MSNQETEPTKYSPEYFAGAFPPNHNPIIGHNHLDTISNVCSALCFIRESYEAPDYESEKGAEREPSLFLRNNNEKHWILPNKSRAAVL